MSAAFDGWTPVRVGGAEGEPFVEWARLGGRRYTEPFFEQTLEAAMREPFNTAFRRRTSLDALLDAVPGDAALPAGFVFHMSHCGSTLVAQMLAALDDHVVLSEPSPLDAIVRLRQRVPGLPDDLHARLLRAMLAALARGPRTFVKWHMSHVLEMPLIARAFPGVPWIFLYREPLEVLVAQTRGYGYELYAGAAGGASMEEHAATVLAAVCHAALRHASPDAAYVAYRELPDALFTRVLPHFGVPCDEEHAARMRAVAARNAKDPQRSFVHDAQEKKDAASAHLRALAATYLEAPYRALISASAPAAR